MENFQRMLRVQIVDTPFPSETRGIHGFQSLNPSVNRTTVRLRGYLSMDLFLYFACNTTARIEIADRPQRARDSRLCGRWQFFVHHEGMSDPHPACSVCTLRRGRHLPSRILSTGRALFLTWAGLPRAGPRELGLADPIPECKESEFRVEVFVWRQVL